MARFKAQQAQEKLIMVRRCRATRDRNQRKVRARPKKKRVPLVERHDNLLFFFLSAWVVTAYLSLQREVFAAFFCSYAVLHTQLFALYSLTEIENVHLRFGFRQDKKAVVFLFLPPCVVFSVVGGSGVVAWAGFTRHVCEAEFRRALC